MLPVVSVASQGFAVGVRAAPVARVAPAVINFARGAPADFMMSSALVAPVGKCGEDNEMAWSSSLALTADAVAHVMDADEDDKKKKGCCGCCLTGCACCEGGCVCPTKCSC